jgi:hypothetical protein
MEIGKDLVAASATPLVLAILSEGQSYGYAIIKRVGELSRGELHWTDGMLYPLLHRLERKGYVKAVWGRWKQAGGAAPSPDRRSLELSPVNAVSGGGRYGAAGPLVHRCRHALQPG